MTQSDILTERDSRKKSLAVEIAGSTEWKSLVKYAELIIGDRVSSNSIPAANELKMFIKTIASWSDRPFQGDAHGYSFGEQDG